MTSLSTKIGLPDINNKCPNDNSTNSCYSLGIKSGLVAGQEMRDSHFVYSLVGGVGGQHSPNFSYGYLLGFDKGFHKQTNNIYIRSVANKTGWDDGGHNTTASPSRPCTVNTLFCITYTTAYRQSYKYNIPYWVGVAAGEKYADHVINTCTQRDHPDFRFLEHHAALYKQGFLNGYSDSVAEASNDNGTYGPKNCKRGAN